MSTKLLIDGDVLAFGVAAGCEVNIRWDDGIWSTQLDERTAFVQADQRIKDWRSILKADSILIAFSDPRENWRKSVLPTYKQNRKGTKPLGWAPLREYLMETYPNKVLPTLEADDVLGLEATKKKAQKQIIVSIDKDLKTIPGYLWNPDKPELGVQEFSKEEADYNHLKQALTGDSTDGYTGCPGVGPKTAAKILDGVSNPWKEVVEVYEKAGLSEDFALEQARVARILRHREYDYKKGKVRLWQPPKN